MILDLGDGFEEYAINYELTNLEPKTTLNGNPVST